MVLVQVEERFALSLKEIEENMNDVIAECNNTGTGIKFALEYVLRSSGKRIRPLLVRLIADSLCLDRDVMLSALALELIHTSSLIVDDLPCMDDDDERRGKPTLHKAFDEATAILTSYTLIPLSYDYVWRNAQVLKASGIDAEEVDRAYGIVMESLYKNSGIHGLIGGQFEDMFLVNKDRETILNILQKKTGALFEIALVMGWAFGGGNINVLDKVKALAYHFGIFFQVCDDILDYSQDQNKEDIGLNYAILFGLEEAMSVVDQEEKACYGLLNDLSKEGMQNIEDFLFILSFLKGRIKS